MAGGDNQVSNVALFTVATLLLTEADDPLWTELWSAGTTAMAWIGARTEPVLEVVAAIAALLIPPGNLTVVPGVVLGAVTLLPECYQVPIIDLLISLVGTAATVLTLPLVLAGPIVGSVSHAVTGFFVALTGLGQSEKVAMLANVASMMRGSFLVDLTLGLLVGAVGGLWGGLVDLVMLTVAAIAAAVGSVFLIPGVMAAVVSAAALFARSQRDRADNAERPEVEEPAVEEPAVDPIADPGLKEPTAPAEPMSFEELAAALGRGWELLAQGAEWLGAKLAEGFAGFVANAEAGAYTMGEWMGWLAATLAFDYFLTFGLGAIAKAIPVLEKLFLGLKAVADSMDAVLGAVLGPLTRLAGLADEALAGLGAALRAIPFPFLDELVVKVGKLRDELVRWFDETLAWIRKQLGLEDAPSQLPEDPDAPKHPKKKPDGDENSETVEAAMVWAKLVAAMGGGLLTRVGLQSAVDAIETGDTDIVNITIDDQDAEHAWEADILLKDGDRASTVEGWTAYGETPTDRHYGRTDARAENEEEAGAALDELEAAWQALFEGNAAPTDPELAEQTLQAAADAVEPKHDAKLRYAADSALSLDVGDDAALDEGDATVTGTVVITPNSYRKGRKLIAGGPEDLYAKFKASGELDLVHPDAMPDVKQGLDKLSGERPETATFTAAREHMLEDWGSAVFRLWNTPLITKVAFSEHATGQAVAAVDQAVTNLAGEVADAPSTPDAQRKFVEDRRSNIHERARFYPNVLNRFQGEVFDSTKDPSVIPALVPDFEGAVRDDRPEPDYAAILKIYENVATVAGVSFTMPAEATEKTCKSARDMLREAILVKFDPTKDPGALKQLNSKLLATSDPIPSSQNGFKGSIFEHWVHKYHQLILDSGQRPYFTVVSGGRSYEVCADGSVKDDCILVECKTVVVRGGVAEPPGKDMIAQMKRYSDIFENNTSWLDATGTVRLFKKVHYIFACQEAIDAWKKALGDALGDNYKAILGGPT